MPSSRIPRPKPHTLGWHLPLAAVRVTSTFSLPSGSLAIQARYDVVSAGYFKTLRIAMRGGREFDDRDTPTGEPVAVVNETMANRFAGDAIGQTVKLSNEKTPRRVVGVARDIKYNAITESSLPFVYLPLTQAYDPICTSTFGRVPLTRRPSSGTLSGRSTPTSPCLAFERSTIRSRRRSPCRGPRRSSPLGPHSWPSSSLSSACTASSRPPSSVVDESWPFDPLWELGRQRSSEE